MTTPVLRSESRDFAAWYGEVVRRAGLAGNSPVRGAMIIKPYGYAIWEVIQRELDDRIKATGHENSTSRCSCRPGCSPRKPGWSAARHAASGRRADRAR